MKLTQNPETGKLILDGEGETILITTVIPVGEPIEAVQNFIFMEEEIDEP